MDSDGFGHCGPISCLSRPLMLTPRSNRILKSPELALSPVADPSHHAVLDRPRRIDWRFENHAATRISGLTEPIVEHLTRHPSVKLRAPELQFLIVVGYSITDPPCCAA
jgi:hypothetical protein